MWSKSTDCLLRAEFLDEDCNFFDQKSIWNNRDIESFADVLALSVVLQISGRFKLSGVEYLFYKNPEEKFNLKMPAKTTQQKRGQKRAKEAELEEEEEFQGSQNSSPALSEKEQDEPE